MKASDFDRKFDEAENVTAELDLSKAWRPAQKQRRIKVWVPERLERKI
jgi:hypothetical protein